MANETFSASRPKPGAPFTASEARDALVKKELAAERAAFEAKTIKLRALRLAKEEEERAIALKKAAEGPPPRAPRKRAVAKKPT